MSYGRRHRRVQGVVAEEPLDAGKLAGGLLLGLRMRSFLMEVSLLLRSEFGLAFHGLASCGFVE